LDQALDLFELSGNFASVALRDYGQGVRQYQGGPISEGIFSHSAQGNYDLGL
jgi:hypothetical protein